MYYMNRSIFKVWKQKDLNHKTKRNFIFQYIEINKYKWLGNKFNNKYFDYKFEHFNLKFSILDKNNKTNYKYNYLTCNTDEYAAKTSEYIGKITLKRGNQLLEKNQYINYNYQALVTDKTDKFIVKPKNNIDIEISKNIEKVLIDSGKIPTIEEKLNKGLEFFINCMKYNEKFNNCYQTLMINHGENAEIIAKVFFHNYF